eukprot:gene6547-4720_t
MAQRRLTEVVPALGESITEGTIAKWAKAEGDNVNADDVVVVVETDKVTVDIKANFRGVVVKHLAKENKPQTGVDFFTLKDAAFYGRPKLSAKEIAAIESGGAY